MSEPEAFTTQCDVLKVDDELGLVFGFGIICTENGQPYFDTQGDHIPDEAMLKSTADFMQSARIAGDMHKQEDGMVVFSFPLTADVAKALDIVTPRTGWLVAVKPSTDVLAKFKSGEYTGFSIGGKRVRSTPVEE